MLRAGVLEAIKAGILRGSLDAKHEKGIEGFLDAGTAFAVARPCQDTDEDPDTRSRCGGHPGRNEGGSLFRKLRGPNFGIRGVFGRVVWRSLCCGEKITEYALWKMKETWKSRGVVRVAGEGRTKERTGCLVHRGLTSSWFSAMTRDIWEK